jgi:heat shock protein HslJ
MVRRVAVDADFSMTFRISLRAVGLGAAALALAVSAASAQQQRNTRPEVAPPDQIVPQPLRERQFPLGASWTAVSLNGRALGGERPTLVISDQLRASGFGGCNSYSATAFPLREQGIAVGPVAVTRRACPGGAGETERAYLVALRGARQWDLQDGRLILRGAGGELRFERAI